MNNLFRNKYLIPSTRLAGYDYGQPGFYFVTICTELRAYYFGRVVDGEMVLSTIGQIAMDCWSKIPEHFPHVMLDEFVIMPNHVHGIIVINRDAGGIDGGAETQNFASLP